MQGEKNLLWLVDILLLSNLSNLILLTITPFIRHYKKPPFISQLVEIIRKLHVPSWITSQIPLEDITVHKVSGSLTNSVFFVSCPTVSSTSTLLLRIYGSSSGSLVSRPKELQTLHTLSSRYNIGPRVYGTFENGRIEEYFDSVTLTSSDIRNPQISRWIGARMAELHSVDVDVVDGTSEGKKFQIAANVNSWVTSAKEVLRLPSVSDSTRQELDLSRFKDEWNRYFAWATREGRGLGSKRVFAHNDTQYGNLLRLKDRSGGIDGHRQVYCYFLSLSNILSLT
jgi:choline kinase